MLMATGPIASIKPNCILSYVIRCDPSTFRRVLLPHIVQQSTLVDLTSQVSSLPQQDHPEEKQFEQTEESQIL